MNWSMFSRDSDSVPLATGPDGVLTPEDVEALETRSDWPLPAREAALYREAIDAAWQRTGLPR